MANGRRSNRLSWILGLLILALLIAWYVLIPRHATQVTTGSAEGEKKAVAETSPPSGAPAAGFFDFLDGAGRDELARIAVEAETAGVFGVPTFVVDGELFWGGDRIWMVREKLGGTP